MGYDEIVMIQSMKEQRCHLFPYVEVQTANLSLYVNNSKFCSGQICSILCERRMPTLVTTTTTLVGI
jgi:hypothetical protein